MKVKLSHFLQWRMNLFLYLILGWSLTKTYIFFLGNIYFLLKRKEKHIIRNAVSEVVALRQGTVDMEDVIKKVFRGIFSHYYEKIYIAFENKKRATEFLNRHIQCRDLVILHRCLLKGKGVILITGHYGAIEYFPTLLAVNDFDITMIAKFNTRQLKRQVFSQAEKYKIRLIDGENTGHILKRAIRDLGKNRVLVTQCDEIDEWRPSQKWKTSFLGQVTGLDRTINIIQQRTKAEVVFGIIHRYNLCEYKLIMYSYGQMSKLLGEKAPITPGETVLKVLEQFIFFHPEQWYQWKKYPELGDFSISVNSHKKSETIPILPPVFGEQYGDLMKRPVF